VGLAWAICQLVIGSLLAETVLIEADDVIIVVVTVAICG